MKKWIERRRKSNSGRCRDSHSRPGKKPTRWTFHEIAVVGTKPPPGCWNFASGAIQMAQRRLLICGCMLVCLLLACQEVLGLELRHSKEDFKLDPNFSSVDEKNMFRTENGTLIELFPVPEAHLQFAYSTRRKLGEFLGCAFCKCCDAAKTFCKAGLPCCYSINCNVQPFGFCKFVPIACNCKECGI